jgi:hypothetical protein
MSSAVVKILNIPVAISLMLSIIATKAVAFVFGRLVPRPSMTVLKTIKLSHYCEKARWGLDLCNTDFNEESKYKPTNKYATHK